MSQFLRINIKIMAVLIFLAGFPAAFLMVRQHSPDRHVVAGIALSFALLALCMWFSSAKNPKFKMALSIIVLAGGLVCGLLVGYRVGYSPAPPWSWDKKLYVQMVVGPYIDLIAALIPWSVFFLLGRNFFHCAKNQLTFSEEEKRAGA